MDSIPPTPPNPELLRSLGRLVRGLSALFWGLPAGLVICFHTVKAEGLMRFGMVPPVVCMGVLFYGLRLLGDFQKQERVWQRSLDGARLLALVNLGLSPFLFWFNRLPGVGLYLGMVVLMTFTALTFLGSLNLVLQRLGAMLPDETLRQDIHQFTRLNLGLLVTTILFTAGYLIAGQFRHLPRWLGSAIEVIDRAGFSLLILLVLLPMAMTMALIWKTKEVILESVFGGHRE